MLSSIEQNRRAYERKLFTMLEIKNTGCSTFQDNRLTTLRARLTSILVVLRLLQMLKIRCRSDRSRNHIVVSDFYSIFTAESKMNTHALANVFGLCSSSDQLQMEFIEDSNRITR